MQVSGTALLPGQTLTHLPYGPNSSAPQGAEGLNHSQSFTTMAEEGFLKKFLKI